MNRASQYQIGQQAHKKWGNLGEMSKGHRRCSGRVFNGEKVEWFVIDEGIKYTWIHTDANK